MELTLRKNWNSELEMSLGKRILLFFHISSLVLSQHHEYFPSPTPTPHKYLWYLTLMLGYGQPTSQALGHGKTAQLFFDIFLGVSGQQSNCVHFEFIFDYGSSHSVKKSPYLNTNTNVQLW